MAIPTGTWNLITDLHSSTLTITNNGGTITGTIQVGPSETHNVSGTWDDTNKVLVFSYNLNVGTGPIFPMPITFTGYLFHGAHQQLFMQPPGPVSDNTPWNLLAGTYQGIFIFPGSHPRGWVARMA